jgi:hypothetical protein
MLENGFSVGGDQINKGAIDKSQHRQPEIRDRLRPGALGRRDFLKNDSLDEEVRGSQG